VLEVVATLELLSVTVTLTPREPAGAGSVIVPVSVVPGAICKFARETVRAPPIVVTMAVALWNAGAENVSWELPGAKPL
jgi:hypothetical protein